MVAGRVSGDVVGGVSMTTPERLIKETKALLTSENTDEKVNQILRNQIAILRSINVLLSWGEEYN